MKVTFTKRDSRRYSVHVERDRAPDLWCGSTGSRHRAESVNSAGRFAPGELTKS